jgi:hypothetical protein
VNDSSSTAGRRLKLFALGVVLVAVAANFGVALHHAQKRARKQNCLSNMAAIGLASRLWASDRDGQMPRTLTEMSNEVVTPKVLFCTADPDTENLREQMKTWDKFDERRSSYEIVNPGISESNPTNVFIRCKAHGHLGYVDGSVFDGKRRMSGYEAKFGTAAPGTSTSSR